MTTRPIFPMLVLAMLLVASPAHATRTVEINAGGVGGFPGADIAAFISGAGFSVGGRLVGIDVHEFPAGHYTFDTSDEVFVVGGPPIPNLTAQLHLEFSFPPITVLSLGPFVGAGQSETEPMSMIGFFTAPGFETVNLFGQGIASAGWFPRDSPNFGLFRVGFTFLPEPSSIALVALGIVAIGVVRRLKG
jgi:hypothetical protein